MDHQNWRQIDVTKSLAPESYLYALFFSVADKKMEKYIAFRYLKCSFYNKYISRFFFVFISWFFLRFSCCFHVQIVVKPKLTTIDNKDIGHRSKLLVLFPFLSLPELFKTFFWFSRCFGTVKSTRKISSRLWMRFITRSVDIENEEQKKVSISMELSHKLEAKRSRVFFCQFCFCFIKSWTKSKIVVHLSFDRFN